HASASTFSTFPRISGPQPNPSIPTMPQTSGAASTVIASGPEDLRELVRSRDLELIVAALAGRFVRAPPLKRRGVPEAAALHMIVLDFADPLDAKRLP